MNYSKQHPSIFTWASQIPSNDRIRSEITRINKIAYFHEKVNLDSFSCRHDRIVPNGLIDVDLRHSKGYKGKMWLLQNKKVQASISLVRKNSFKKLSSVLSLHKTNSFVRIEIKGMERELRYQAVNMLQRLMRRKSDQPKALSIHFKPDNENRLKYRSLLQAARWTNLKYLELISDIDDHSLSLFTSKSKWDNLKYLDLSFNKIQAEGVNALANKSNWHALERLELSYNRIGSFGAFALAQNKTWRNLLSLNLICCNIGARGAKSLSENTIWVELKDLDLAKNHIGDEGAVFVGENRSWTKLQYLNLSCNNIRDEGATGLAKNTIWKELRALYLGNSFITRDGRASLQRLKFITPRLTILFNDS